MAEESSTFAFVGINPSQHPLVLGHTSHDIIIHHKRSGKSIYLDSDYLPGRLTESLLNDKLGGCKLPIEALLCFFERFIFAPGRIIATKMTQLEWYWCMLVADLLELPQDSEPFVMNGKAVPFSSNRELEGRVNFEKTFDFVAAIRRRHSPSVIRFILFDLCDFSTPSSGPNRWTEAISERFDRIAKWYGTDFFVMCLKACSRLVPATKSGYEFEADKGRCNRSDDEYVRLWTMSNVGVLMRYLLNRGTFPVDYLPFGIRHIAYCTDIVVQAGSWSFDAHSWILEDRFEPFKMLLELGDPQVKDGKWSVPYDLCDQCIVAQVMRCLLYFIYTGTLGYSYEDDDRFYSDTLRISVKLGFASLDENTDIDACDEMKEFLRLLRL
jgi:hypothetical protein